MEFTGRMWIVEKAKALLAPFTSSEPLSNDKSADGKSLVNKASGQLSSSYTAFPDPISRDTNGFDIHVYYFPGIKEHEIYVKALYERIRREFPELRIYRLWDRPVGPHPTAMFEVNIFTPSQFGAIIPFLVVNRGPLSVLVHPNTGDVVGDHMDKATWIGPPLPLDKDVLLAFQ